MSSNEIADFLTQTSPAFKFLAVGDEVRGTITSVRVNNGMSLDKIPVPEKTLVIGVDTDGGEEVSVWVKKGQMLTALSEAVRTAKPGAAKPTIDELDRISIKFVGTEPSKQNPSFNPKKIYAVTYKAAAQSGVKVDDL